MTKVLLIDDDEEDFYLIKKRSPSRSRMTGRSTTAKQPRKA
jgi:hypothetical protein